METNRNASLRQEGSAAEADLLLIPKPLRITKRQPQRTSYTIKQLLSSTKAATSSGAVGSNDTSFIRSTSSSSRVRDGANDNALNARRIRPTKQAQSPSPSASDALTIRKQRRSDTASVSVTDILTTEHAHVTNSRPSHSPPTIPEFIRYSSTETQVDSRIKKGRHDSTVDEGPLRAVTLVEFLRSEPLGPSNTQGHHRSTSVHLPRAQEASTQRAHPSELQTTSIFDGDTTLSRRQSLKAQFSSKNRLFDRVMSGLTVKLNTSHVAMERRQLSQPEPSANAQSEIPRLETGTRARTRAATTSSADTGSSLGSQLDNTLAAFPSPPRPTVKSPVISPAKSSYVSILSRPGYIEPIAASLRVTPEVDILGGDNGQSILVAVEIMGLVGQTVKRGHSSIRQCRLDIAVVIDNSLSTSPAALMATCEATVYLSTILDTDQDRLAVICTHTPTTKAGTLEVVVPLGETNARKTREAMDLIFGSSKKSDSATVEHALTTAKEILLHSKPHVLMEKPEIATMGHVLLFSSDISNLSADDLNNEMLQIHWACPGPLPWNCQNKVTSNGWQLLPTQEGNGAPTASNQDRDGNGLHTEIFALISHVRGGLDPGRLTDLILEVEAAPYCSIEGEMSKKAYPFLHPGECITALVKVKIGTVPAGPPALSKFPRGSRTPSGSVDLLKEINSVLEESVPIMTARLRYKHSMLPNDTHCLVESAALLKRFNQDFQKELHSFKSDLLGFNQSQLKVQRSLIYYLATHHVPHQALSTLRDEFGAHGCLSVCPKYWKRVTDELKYQARILERFDLPGSESRTLADPQMEPVEHFGQGLVDVNSYKPQDWFPTSKGEDRPDARKPSDKSKSVNRAASKEKENVDEARRIWGDLRKKSKGHRGLEGIGKRIARTESSEEKLRQIQETAVKNKRSVGADTLKSIANGGRTVGSFSPYM